MTAPIVSVILTSFNHEQFIGEAVESVLSQSFTDYELIIWDDASTDNSWSIINSFQDGRIRTFRNASNTCGEYFDKTSVDWKYQGTSKRNGKANHIKST